MRIFITGIDGMLGSALRATHEAAGDIVHGCDIRAFTPEHTLCDIRDDQKLRSMISAYNPQRIYHCAAMLGVANTERYPSMCRDVNEQGTLNVAQIAADLGTHLVFLSSSEVYGNQEGPIKEIAPLLGDNVYAISKARGESIVESYSGSMRVTVCRMFNCYGPRQVRQFFVPKTIHKALKGEPIKLYGDRENKRSYLLSTDAAMYLTQVADYAMLTKANNLIVNVAHPTTVTLQYVAETIAFLTKSSSEIVVQTGDIYEDRKRERDIPNRIADRTVLDCIAHAARAPYGIADGLQVAVQSHETTFADWSYCRDKE